MNFYQGKLENIGDLIYVFGSNIRGVHGASTALEARKRYGAILGRGFGLMGQSYALPTKDYSIRTLDLQTIEAYVEGFRLFVQNNQNLKFYITPIGTGLAGYQHSDIAPMFRNMVGKERCWYLEDWRPYL